MVPRLAAPGSSFQGAFLYYCHDKQARTTDRVAWTETVNLMTDCLEKAWKVMAYTAKIATQLKRATGKKRAADRVEKPVIAYSLSWHPEQKPDKQTMLEAAKTSLAQLGLQEHEAVILAHRDEPHPHVHVVVNRIHPLTGMAANLYRSKRKLQDWAREFQEKEGTRYCPKREENYQKRRRGQTTRYGDPKVIEAWEASSDGMSFQNALKRRGYDLAIGRKRPVIVDPYGKTLNPVRLLPDVTAQEFKARLTDIDLTQLPTPEEIIAARTTTEKQPRSENHNHTTEQEESLLAAITKAERFQKMKEQTVQEASQARFAHRKTELIARFKIREQQATINHLEEMLKARGLLRRFAHRILGHDRRTKERLLDFKLEQRRAIRKINIDLDQAKIWDRKSPSTLCRHHVKPKEFLTKSTLSNINRFRHSATKKVRTTNEHPIQQIMPKIYLQ